MHLFRLHSFSRACTPALLLLLLAVTLPLAGAEKQTPAPREGGALSPAASQATMRLFPGLRVELVAAEPQIESPVALAFDEDGKLWVVEMRDYPNGPAPGKPAEGRIRLLEDRDGDGRYETSSVFADQLLFANGLLPWRGGLVVTAAPYVIYLKDTDGDGRADQREVLYEGFAAQNPQLRVSHPVLGLDNWIYVANGLRGGKVRRAGKADAEPVSLSGMDFRFDLVRDRHEAISGPGQFGNTFDDWGQRFVCDNRHHLRHVVLPSRAIQRNPFLAVPEVVEDISVLEGGPLNSGGKIHPISKNWTTSSLHVGRFTAACGVFIYRGTLLPEAYRGSAFTCDPTGNLVHQEVLEPAGATFRARPPRDGVEFLASTDEWFRPVSLAHGYDGALYLVDMYRAVIEHPEFMPAELKNRPDLTWGKDRGRIYRLVPDQGRPAVARPRLSKASVAELVALLKHPDAWWRTTAQRLLLERQDQAAVEPLRQLTSAAEPLARAHAAWLLEAFGALDADAVGRLLADAHPRVREQAVLLAGPRLAGTEALRSRVRALADDADPRVRYQVALTLGEIPGADNLPALARVALAGAGDRWTRTAVATAVPNQAGALLTLLLKSGLTAQPSADRLALLRELTTLVGARRETAEVASTLDDLLGLQGTDAVRWQMAGLNGLADGMGRRGTQLGAFLAKLPAAHAPTAARMTSLLQEATALAGDSRREAAERLAAVRLLAHAPWDTAAPVLTRLFTQDAEQEVRLAAVRSLAAHAHREVPATLMRSWKSYTPPVRREVSEVMLRQPDRVQFFLGELEAGRVKPGDLDALRARQLVNHARPEIRERARKLLQDSLPAERKQVLEQYRAALSLQGDAERGKAIFQKNCATCHRVGGIGVDVGPDIGDTRTKTAEMLLLDVLNPNQAIDNNFINYVVTTKNGKVLTGVIALETASSITLRRAENQTDVVLRQDVDEIQSTGVSLMPEGLEKTITVPEMADLLSFLKNWRYLDGAVPPGVRAGPGDK